MGVFLCREGLTFPTCSADKSGMSKPYIHAKSSARKHGGKAEDYLDIHQWFDASKSWWPDNRHRVFRHHAEGIFECETVFGCVRVNSDGREYSVRDIGEQHVAEDFGGKFIPCVADYMNGMDMQGWMNNGIGGCPPSYQKVADYMKARRPATTTHVAFDKTEEDAPPERLKPSLQDTTEALGIPEVNSEEPTVTQQPKVSIDQDRLFAALKNMPRLHDLIPDRPLPEVVLDGTSVVYRKPDQLID